jgi:hypothetical protein
MALRLEHFLPAENPDLYYRRVGEPAVQDFLNRGVVAGTQKYGTQAYFLRGGEWSTGGAPYRITMDASRLNPAGNPLYGDLNFNRYLADPKIFPIGGANNGMYPRLTPSASPTFWDRINPSNRAGLKIDDTRTGRVIYDRTNPITRTPLSTTLKNAQVEVGIVGGAILPAASTFMNYAGVIPLVTSELERKRSDYQNPITQEYFTKDKVVELDGLTYDSATPKQIAMYHPDNAEDHPEITDEMRKKFYPKWFK